MTFARLAWPHAAVAALLGAAISTAACAQAEPEPEQATVVQPGAPGEPSRTVAATAPTALAHTDADVVFMQGMIHHHGQALEMTALIADRSEWDTLALLGQRIDVSQADEMKMMREWLTSRDEALPDEHAMHQPGAMLMPGMLTPDEMTALAAATGREFERLFLEGMIKHHRGALTMVTDLLAQPGAGQQADVFAFASDIDADQSMEIDRMSAMLASIR